MFDAQLDIHGKHPVAAGAEGIGEVVAPGKDLDEGSLAHGRCEPHGNRLNVRVAIAVAEVHNSGPTVGPRPFGTGARHVVIIAQASDSARHHLARWKGLKHGDLSPTSSVNQGSCNLHKCQQHSKSFMHQVTRHSFNTHVAIHRVTLPNPALPHGAPDPKQGRAHLHPHPVQRPQALHKQAEGDQRRVQRVPTWGWQPAVPSIFPP